MILWCLAAAYAGTLTVDVLDIGQGDAIYIETDDGANLLIDTGDRRSNTEEQLRTLGVSKLDYVVATHPHADHIGRMPQVLSTFEVGLYIDNGLEHTTATYAKTMDAVKMHEVPHEVAQKGWTAELDDDVTITILFPSEQLLRGTRSDLNSNSVVVRLEHDEVTYLFTGDSEDETERAVLADWSYGPVDVLKVAHHGGKHSTSPAWLDIMRPTYAIISCGADNRYGHPKPETLERLANVDAQVYRTDVSGHVRVISDGQHIEVLEGPLEEIVDIEVPDDLGSPTDPVAEGPEVPEGVTDPPTREEEALTWCQRHKKRRQARREARRERRAKRREARKRRRFERAAKLSVPVDGPLQMEST